MNNLIQHPLTLALGWTLLHSLWQLTLIALVYRLATRWLVNKRAQIQYIVAMSTLVLMLASVVGTFGIIYERPLSGTSFSPPPAQIDPPPPLLEESLPIIAPNRISTAIAIPQRPWWEDIPDQVSQAIKPYLPILTLGWLVGVGLLALQFVGSCIWLYHLRHKGIQQLPPEWKTRFESLTAQFSIRRRVTLHLSTYVREPLTIGHWKPVVLLPLGLLTQQPPEQIEAILLHELAHIRRYDFVFNILQTWVEMLLFYHPAVWWVSRQVRETREHCCDDMAVAICRDPIVYAKALTQLQKVQNHTSEQVRPRLALTVKGNYKPFSQRIYRIMGQPASRSTSGKGLLLAILLSMVAVGLALQSPAKLIDRLDQMVSKSSTYQYFTLKSDTEMSQLNEWFRGLNSDETINFTTNWPSGVKKWGEAQIFSLQSKSKPELTFGGDSLQLIFNTEDQHLYALFNEGGYIYNISLADWEGVTYHLNSNQFSSSSENKVIERHLTNLAASFVNFPKHTPLSFSINPQTTVKELIVWDYVFHKLGFEWTYPHMMWDDLTGELTALTIRYEAAPGDTQYVSTQALDKLSVQVDPIDKSVSLACEGDCTYKQERSIWQRILASDLSKYIDLQRKQNHFFLDDQLIDKKLLAEIPERAMEIQILSSVEDEYIQQLYPGLSGEQALMIYTKRSQLIVPGNTRIVIGNGTSLQKLDHPIFSNPLGRYGKDYESEEFDEIDFSPEQGVLRLYVTRVMTDSGVGQRVGIKEYLPSISNFSTSYLLNREEALEKYGLSGKYGLYVEEIRSYPESIKPNKKLENGSIKLTFPKRAFQKGRGKISHSDELFHVNIGINSLLVVNGKLIPNNLVEKGDAYTKLLPDEIEVIRFLSLEESNAKYANQGQHGAVEITTTGASSVSISSQSLPKFYQNFQPTKGVTLPHRGTALILVNGRPIEYYDFPQGEVLDVIPMERIGYIHYIEGEENLNRFRGLNPHLNIAGNVAEIAVIETDLPQVLQRNRGTLPKAITQYGISGMSGLLRPKEVAQKREDNELYTTNEHMLVQKITHREKESWVYLDLSDRSEVEILRNNHKQIRLVYKNQIIELTFPQYVKDYILYEREEAIQQYGESGDSHLLVVRYDSVRQKLVQSHLYSHWKVAEGSVWDHIFRTYPNQFLLILMDGIPISPQKQSPPNLSWNDVVSIGLNRPEVGKLLSDNRRKENYIHIQTQQALAQYQQVGQSSIDANTLQISITPDTRAEDLQLYQKWIEDRGHVISFSDTDYDTQGRLTSIRVRQETMSSPAPLFHSSNLINHYTPEVGRIDIRIKGTPGEDGGYVDKYVMHYQYRVDGEVIKDKLAYKNPPNFEKAWKAAHPGYELRLIHKVWGSDALQAYGILPNDVYGVKAYTSLPMAYLDRLDQEPFIVYPNPVEDNRTQVLFELGEKRPVKVTVHDMQGRQIQTLVDKALEKGIHAYTWETAGLSKGTYLIRLNLGEWDAPYHEKVIKN